MGVRLLIGDCRERLRDLRDKSVQCVVTSPPYFGLRDYGVDGQMGAEPTPNEYVAALVEVFREVRRVLRDDGTVWLNLGDSYAANGKSGLNVGWSDRAKDYAGGGHRAEPARNRTKKQVPPGLKQKDLIGVPWRVAFALQDDGWYLRQDIVWHKPNPMPESCRDRCTKAHEYVFLLTKLPQYYYDHEAIKEPGTGRPVFDNNSSRARIDDSRNDQGRHNEAVAETRNRRSVWTVSTRPYKGAHFATFPPALIEPCILAGCPVNGTVLDPFAGSGTTGYVADYLQRHAVLIDLNPEYEHLIRGRFSDGGALFSTLEVVD